MYNIIKKPKMQALFFQLLRSETHVPAFFDASSFLLYGYSAFSLFFCRLQVVRSFILLSAR